MRLLIHTEGKTEEEFVHELLRPHLLNCGYSSVESRGMGNARLRAKRQGVKAWDSVKTAIERHLKEDKKAIASTFVDYYAMPRSGAHAWPGRQQSTPMTDPIDKTYCLQSALTQSIDSTLSYRFVPFVMIYEFEALLFSDCATTARALHASHKVEAALQAIRASQATPEHINDSPQTAPSKRLENLFPSYQKPLHGNLAALEIGLTTMRRECPGFDRWIGRLEKMGATF